MEWNQYENWTKNTQIKNAVESENGVHTIWLTRPFTAAEVRQAVIESECSGVLLEGEIPAETGYNHPNPQAVNWVEMIWALEDLDVAKGVITNFAPFTRYDGSPYPEKSRPLVEAGWSCVTECYDMQGDPTNWIEQRAFFARHLGWDVTQPALGCYDGRTLQSFPNRDNYFNWSCWSAEYLL